MPDGCMDPEGDIDGAELKLGDIDGAKLELGDAEGSELKEGPIEASGAWLMQQGVVLPWAFPASIWVLEGHRL